MDPQLIQFRDNGTAHRNLHISLEDYFRLADSYYLAIDSALLPDDETADRVRHVLIRLLQRWTDAVEKATPTQPAYLPFDFSDQYTGCFQCRPDGDTIEIVAGTSLREAWRVVPSDPGDYLFGITDFRPDATSLVRLPKAEFLRQIQESIADAESQLSTNHESPR